MIFRIRTSSLWSQPSGAAVVTSPIHTSVPFAAFANALDTSAQIIAYAIILGYSQQLFTGFVDRQAQAVLVEAGNVPPQPPAGRPGGARLRNTSDVD
jgi:hypothetical protein